MPDRRTLMEHADKLGALLTQLTAVYRDMLTMHEHRTAAVRSASVAKLRELAEIERSLVQAAAEIERHRLAAAAALTLAIDPEAKRPWRVSELAEHLPDAMRDELMQRRNTLEKVCIELRTRTEVSRRAAQRLLLHMTGIVQSVCNLIADPGTYERPGHRKHRSDLQRTSLVPAGLNLTA